MKRFRNVIAGAAAVSLAVLTGAGHAGWAVSPGAASAADAVSDDCAAQPITRVTGSSPDAFHELQPQDNRTYDLRELTSIGVPFTTTDPFIFGEEQHSRYLCVLGGTVEGSPEVVDMERNVVKQRWTGPGMHVAGLNGHPSVVDGLRVDLAEDGFAPVGDGFVLRNAYISNIRDDCVENDFLAAGLIEDTLLDGCFMGISTDTVIRPSPVNPEPFVLDGVLMRLKPFLYPNATTIRSLRLFKPRNNSPKPIVVRNSVFLADEWSSPGVWPADFQAENVTLVWLGDGPFPRPVPDGMTVVTDLSVWEDAREDWLVRHGYEPLPDSPGLDPAPESTSGEVSLTWSLGSGAESYRIKRGVSSGPYETIAEVDADVDRSYVDTSVEAGARYFYAISSVNAHGESRNSNEAVAVPVSDAAGAPAGVRNLSALVDPRPDGQQHRGRVNLSWNHVAGAEEYVVWRGTEPGQYDREFVTRSNTYTSVGLDHDITYYYRVVARNRHGSGTPSAEVSAATVLPHRDLPAPVFHPWQQEAASGDPVVAGDGQITLSWLFPRDITGNVFYTIKRSTTPGGPYEDVAQVGPGPGVAAPAYTDTGLENGTTYYYVVQATDESGSSPDSEEVFETPQATPVVPEAPSQLTSALDGNGVQLSWDEVDLAATYTVARSSSLDGPFEPVYRMIRDTAYVDYGIAPDQEYYYRVRAANSFGHGEPSPTTQVSVGALDHAAPVVTVAGIGDGATYTLGDVPTPEFNASDDGVLAWQGDELRPPDTATGAGQYSYIATARDEATNETIAYATYDVRYQFGGFLGALSEPGKTFSPDDPIPVVFRLTDADQQPVAGADYTILVDGVPATPWRERPSGSYIFLLDPRELSEEVHTLTLALDDGTTHRTTFRIGTEGS